MIPTSIFQYENEELLLKILLKASYLKIDYPYYLFSQGGYLDQHREIIRQFPLLHPPGSHPR